jgi:hypothetical protein
LVGQTEREHTGEHRSIWEDNIKVDVKELAWEGRYGGKERCIQDFGGQT